MLEETSIIPKRQIIISQEIDGLLAEKVIEQIIDINNYDYQMSVVSTYQPQPIEIFINSSGGSVTDGFAIIDAMEMSETPIITYGLGCIASMALAIFVTGDIRIATRHTRFIYHSITYGIMGHIKDHEEAQKESDLLQRMYNSIMLERTKLTKELMDDIRNKKSDLFFSAREAVKYGIADEYTRKPEPRVQDTLKVVPMSKTPKKKK